MKLTLKQSGGLAGITRRFVLDTAALAAGREEVEALARAVIAQPIASGAPLPDAMAYTLSIAGEGGTREVGAGDAGATAEFGRLVEHVRKHGKVLAG